MANRKSEVPLDEMIRGMDLPHLREGQRKWLKTGAAPQLKPGFALDRLLYYGNQLKGLGMSNVDIVCLLSDLYWDAVDEYKLNSKAAD